MSADRIDLTVTVSYKLADLLRDPTTDMSPEAKKEMPADARKDARDSAHADILLCIDTLAAAAHFNDGYLDVLNIAAKLGIEHETDTTTAT